MSAAALERVCTRIQAGCRWAKVTMHPDGSHTRLPAICWHWLSCHRAHNLQEHGVAHACGAVDCGLLHTGATFVWPPPTTPGGYMHPLLSKSSLQPLPLAERARL